MTKKTKSLLALLALVMVLYGVGHVLHQKITHYLASTSNKAFHEALRLYQ